jgi:hypothetical protein
MVFYAMTKMLLASVMIPLCLTSCLTYRIISGGQPATDLSWLNLGTTREQVEEILGEPVQIGSSENGIIAVYEYDQGYILPENTGMEWATPVITLYEIGSLGMIDVLEAENRHCQRGLLRVMYDASGKVLAAGECHGITDHEDCSSTRSRRRPSTLSEEFKVNSPAEVGCNYDNQIH